MRYFPLVLLLLAAGCGGGSVTLEGTLADPGSATEVWAMGRAERVPVENGAFRIEALEADTVELRFVTGDDRPARMVLHDLPDGGTLRLDGVWFADEVAFPARAAGGDGRPLVVNGLRMAGPERVPKDVNLAGTVLAVANDGDALVMRPADASLPDLDVIITPASVVRTIDGDLVDADGLEFGDSLRVSGIGEGGRVIAAEIMVSRRAAADDEARRDDAEGGDGGADRRVPEPGVAALARAEAPQGPSRSAGELEKEREKALEKARDRAKDAEKEAAKGRGRGRGRD